MHVKGWVILNVNFPIDMSSTSQSNCSYIINPLPLKRYDQILPNAFLHGLLVFLKIGTYLVLMQKKINDRYLKVVYDPSTVQKQSRVFSNNDSNLKCYITMRPIATILQNAMRKSAGQPLAYSSYKRQGELWQHTFPQELSSSSYPKETKQHILPTKYHKLEETWKGQLN